MIPRFRLLKQGHALARRFLSLELAKPYRPVMRADSRAIILPSLLWIFPDTVSPLSLLDPHSLHERTLRLSAVCIERGVTNLFSLSPEVAASLFLEDYQEALRIFREETPDNPLLQSKQLLEIAKICLANTDLSVAKDYLNQAKEAVKNQSDTPGVPYHMAKIHMYEAMIEQAEGRREQAKLLYNAVAQTVTGSSCPHRHVIQVIANFLLANGNFKDASSHYNFLYEYTAKMPSTSSIEPLCWLSCLATVHLLQGQLSTAEAEYQQCIKGYTDAGKSEHAAAIAVERGNMANVALRQEQYAAADEHAKISAMLSRFALGSKHYLSVFSQEKRGQIKSMMSPIF